MAPLLVNVMTNLNIRGGIKKTTKDDMEGVHPKSTDYTSNLELIKGNNNEQQISQMHDII